MDLAIRNVNEKTSEKMVKRFCITYYIGQTELPRTRPQQECELTLEETYFNDSPLMM